MRDLTLLYITASLMPQRWMEYQLTCLFNAAGRDTPMVVVSRTPCAFGHRAIHLLDEEPRSYWNIYMQMLRASKEAKTPYVAMVEDDTLYSAAHFHEFRPPLDAVSYNRARWSLFSWDPMYCLRQRISNCSLIAPREYLIDALEERQRAWPDEPPADRLTGEVGRTRVDKRLRVGPRKLVEWYSTVPIIHFNHQHGTDEGANKKWKRHGQIKAFDIPHWGKATEIAKVYNDG